MSEYGNYGLRRLTTSGSLRTEEEGEVSPVRLAAHLHGKTSSSMGEAQMHGDFYDLTDSDCRSLRPFLTEDRRMVTIERIGTDVVSLTGKESDGVWCSFSDGSIANSFLSWKSLKQLLNLKQKQQENGKKQGARF